jgi:hypothetical protein
MKRFKLFYYLATATPRLNSIMYVNANNMDHAELLGHALVSRLTLEVKFEIFLGQIEAEKDEFGVPEVRILPHLHSLGI